MNIKEFNDKLNEWQRLPNVVRYQTYPWCYMKVSKEHYYDLLKQSLEEQYKEKREAMKQLEQDDANIPTALDIAYGFMLMAAFVVGMIIGWEVFKAIVYS